MWQFLRLMKQYPKSFKRTGNGHFTEILITW